MSYLRTIFIPAAVFQSVIVGGAYGTGREIVEYISQFGPLGGLFAIGVIAISFALVLAISFEFARIHNSWDYRTYLRELLGPVWIAYEVLFLALLVLILAITGSAAGSVLHDKFSVPENFGIGLMFLLVVLLNYFGRNLVKRTLTLGSLILMGVLVVYFVFIFNHAYAEIKAVVSSGEVKPGWLKSGLTFAIYNSALIPVIVYCASDLQSRTQSVASGLLAGALGVFPALIFHLSFMAGYPAVIEEAIPTYWMIERLGFSMLLTLYVLILFATIVQTGVGVLQGLNERLDRWRRDAGGKSLSNVQHATLAGGLLLLSLVLAKIGIVELVAKGYSALAWGFFIVFTLPTLTIGLAKILPTKSKVEI